MGPDERARAIAALRSTGFAPSLNGSGILVPVSPTGKAAPFRALALSRVAVDDFDLLSPTDQAPPRGEAVP